MLLTKEGQPTITIADRLRIKDQKLVPLIVGGIGPLSHTDFERFLLRVNQEAHSDQEHPGYGLLNATVFPDRTLALKQEEEGNPALAREIEERIISYAAWAQAQGFDFLVFICNTIHNWYPRVEDRLPIPWLHMMRATAAFIKEQQPEVKKVGVLATDGTLMGGLYHQALQAAGLVPLAPAVGEAVQEKVMAAIYNKDYGVKATGDSVTEQAKKNLIEAADYLKDKGAQAVIAGCTEISVALTPAEYSQLPIVDPLVVLAGLTVDLAMGRRDLSSI